MPFFHDLHKAHGPVTQVMLGARSPVILVDEVGLANQVSRLTA